MNPTWLNANVTTNNYQQSSLLRKTEAATQTYGISYPSAKDIENLVTQNKQLQAEKEFKEQYPILTSVSPGKGYWRKQVDHISAHIKAYAVNRPDFRSLIGEIQRKKKQMNKLKSLFHLGEPRMGKMVHATVQENEYQVTIQLVFRRPENLSQSSFYIDQRDEHYPMNSERSSTYSSTFNSDGKFLQKQNQICFI